MARAHVIDLGTIHLERVIESDRYPRILKYLSKEIKTAKRRAGEMRKALHDEVEPQEDIHVEGFLIDEEEYLEMLTGMSFLVCQHKITSVVTAALEVGQWLKGYKIKMPLLQGAKNSVALRKCLLQHGKKFSNMNISVVQAIDAAANTYKHSDEWQSWEKAKETHKGAKRTIETLEAIGIKDMRSARITNLAEIFGNKELDNPRIILTRVDEWANGILSEAREEIEAYKK